MKFILGTANLGQKYGITNQNELSKNEILGILHFASSNGINSFDTAASYGSAEQILGKYLSANKIDAEVTTKLLIKPDDTPQSVAKKIQESLNRLTVPKIDNLLVHNIDAIHHETFNEISQSILMNDYVRHFGVSTYNLQEIHASLNRLPELSIIQVPENILDQRLLNHEAMVNLNKKNVKIQVRSIFLQGLLLSESSQLPRNFQSIKMQLNFLRELSQILSCTVLDLCLSYINFIKWKSEVVIAVQNINQLNSILNYKNVEFDWALVPEVSEIIKDPRNWSQL